MFATHHWPRFGKDDVKDFLCLQRDVYRWQHDQTMRLANMGYVPTEIAEKLQLPNEFLKNLTYRVTTELSHIIQKPSIQSI